MPKKRRKRKLARVGERVIKIATATPTSTGLSLLALGAVVAFGGYFLYQMWEKERSFEEAVRETLQLPPKLLTGGLLGVGLGEAVKDHEMAEAVNNADPDTKVAINQGGRIALGPFWEAYKWNNGWMI